MTEPAYPHNRAELDQLVREVVARQYPDVEEQQRVLLDLRLLALAEEPEVIAAQQVLANASPAEMEAAFDMIRARAEQAAAAAATSSRPSLQDIARAMAARAGEIVAPLRALFDVSMVPTAKAMRLGGDEQIELRREDVRQLSFVLPEALSASAGLAPMGKALLGEDELRVIIRRRRPDTPPPLVVAVEGGGYRSPPTPLVILAGTGTIEATLDWLVDTVPETLRLGLLDDDDAG